MWIFNVPNTGSGDFQHVSGNWDFLLKNNKTLKNLKKFCRCSMALTGSEDFFTYISGNHEITTLVYSNVSLLKNWKKKICDCNLSGIKLYISAAAS